MLPLFRHFLGHHNKWTHSWKHINMAFQDRFDFFDTSSSCLDIVRDVLQIVSTLFTIDPFSPVHPQQFISNYMRYERNKTYSEKPYLYAFWHGFICYDAARNVRIMASWIIVLFKNLIPRFNISEVRVMNSRHYYMTGEHE